MKREYGGSNQLGILLLEALGFKDPLIIKKSLFNGLFPFKKKKKSEVHIKFKAKILILILFNLLPRSNSFIQGILFPSNNC